MKMLERAAFLAVFVTMGKFFENELGVWPAVGLSLSVVCLSIGIYLVVNQRRA